MIPKRIALLITPWCFVWLIVIGCSRQEVVQGEPQSSTPKPERLTAIAGPPSGEAVRTPPASMEDRYASLVRAHDDPAELREALIPFYQQWGSRFGEASVEHAMAHNRTLVRDAFAGWIGSDPAAPRAWVLAEDHSQRRQAGLATGLLHALPATDHRSRGEWVAHFAERPSGARLVSEVAIGWGNERPQEALDWLANLPQGRSRSSGIETIFQRWTEADPKVASTHLTRMPSGDAKDLAISSLAKAIHRDDPEAAQLWAQTIADEDLRELTNGLLNKLARSRQVNIPGL